MRTVSAITAGIELRFAGRPLAEAMAAAETEIDISAADTVAGYAARFNVRSQDLGGFYELIAAGAFDGVLEQDVVALFNHDANQPLARSSAGTLRLSVDDIGLRYEFDLAKDDLSEQVARFIADKRVAGSSFGFFVAPDGDKWVRMEDGQVCRTITRFSRLLDVSPCTFPAYLATDVQLRAAGDASASGLAAFLAAEQRTAATVATSSRARELELMEISLGR
ncbi:HK97 family phage prohead protease [Sandarakinorhabdus sp.]|uniref:HK97 family phage prohead protease n=1 Tax=Sandarakinorhabdus sp. TaxID=1916663 RepID=UPI00286E4DD6|nr:HK97 family phage prohead protease [Sandarakinorhabdus sp.]